LKELKEIRNSQVKEDLDMAKGLMGVGMFGKLLSSEERRLAERLAEIEQEDADRCAGCGGEDCICCEYYHDRQRWQSPEELFSEERW